MLSLTQNGDFLLVFRHLINNGHCMDLGLVQTHLVVEATCLIRLQAMEALLFLVSVQMIGAGFHFKIADGVSAVLVLFVVAMAHLISLVSRTEVLGP